MPEILEVESYRALAERTVGATIVKGWADPYSAKKLASPATWARAVKGRQIVGTSRRGKLMILKTDGVTLGVRFGMTGVLLIDAEAGIDGLFYGPHSYRDEWVRGGLELHDGRRLLLHDPRRLARFEIDPNLNELGPDALTLTKSQLVHALHVARGIGPALKARLLDQAVIAGVGNLLGDEILFRAGIDPRRACSQVTSDELAKLYRAFRQTMTTLSRRGGSHTGDHMVARFPGALCPLDGAPMLVATIGGRTTYWCSRHQH